MVCWSPLMATPNEILLGSRSQAAPYGASSTGVRALAGVAESPPSGHTQSSTIVFRNRLGHVQDTRNRRNRLFAIVSSNLGHTVLDCNRLHFLQSSPVSAIVSPFKIWVLILIINRGVTIPCSFWIRVLITNLGVVIPCSFWILI